MTLTQNERNCFIILGEERQFSHSVQKLEEDNRAKRRCAFNKLMTFVFLLKFDAACRHLHGW